MSVLPVDIVYSIAESIGVTLRQDVANVLIEDTEYRLREIIHESVKYMRHSNRRKLNPSDLNSALSVKNTQPLYGYTHPIQFKQVLVGNQPLYYLEDAEIDLEELVNRPLPPVPLEVTFTAHWLAIEGVQPRIVQNPTSSERMASQDKLTDSTPTEKAKVLSKDPLVKEVLTKELNQYFEKITNYVTSESKALQVMAVESLSSDPGIQALMPYFAKFINDSIIVNLKTAKSLHFCTCLMIMVDSLLKNKHLFVDPYLHQFISPILTCMVAKKLSLPGEDHLALRRFASSLIKHILNTSGATYPDLQSRITKTLLHSLLDHNKPFSSVYGTLYGMNILGHEVVTHLVLPHVKLFGVKLAGVIPEDQQADADAAKYLMIDILLEHFRQVVSNDPDKVEESIDHYKPIYGDFAESVFEKFKNMV
ncbi:hypothetical protein BC833DRAFT_585615 [Globomyces pollinis-pini]|nr:hypothetical protein BC833DRAFT_585615 [Globomyces pollinis-pini]